MNANWYEKLTEPTNEILNIRGPEIFSYREFVERIAEKIEVKRPIISINPLIALLCGKIIGKIAKDVVITSDEIEGLMKNLLYIDDPPVSQVTFSQWLEDHKNSLGLSYSSELQRRDYMKILT